MQVETLAEAGSYEDALSLCAMCKVRILCEVVLVMMENGLLAPKYATSIWRGLRYREMPQTNAVRSPMCPRHFACLLNVRAWLVLWLQSCGEPVAPTGRRSTP